MNKVVLMGRLAKDPEIRYSQGADPLAVVRFSLAVARRFKREGEQEADFINCVAFGKNGEFAEKYFKKGQMIGVVGKLQLRSWEDRSGTKHWSTDVVVEETYFVESKASFEGRMSHEGIQPSQPECLSPSPAPKQPLANDGFFPIDESLEDDDLPF